MPLSQEDAYQKVLEIYEKIDRNSQNYGCLVNWYEGVSWHYGINLKENLIFDQYLCQFSPESREDFNGKLSFKRGLAEVVILKNSVKVFRKSFLMYSLYYKGLRLGVTF